VIASIPGQDLVAVDLVYHGMDEGDAEPTPLDVMACSRDRRHQILREQPAPAGLVYIWSNLEFDAYAEPEVSDRLLGPAWQEVNELAHGLGTSRRPLQLAADAVIYPAARGGVDPDTAENLRAALTVSQQQQLEAGGLMLLY
jgi:hypothetical protein